MKTIKFSSYLTASEADTIYRLLDELKDAIWQAYGEEIKAMYREIEEISNECKDEGKGFNDDLPF